MTKIDFTDKRYIIPSTNIFNLTKWLRENEPKLPHKYRVGDCLRLITDVEIKSLHWDCDGTPLYELYNLGGGFSEDNLSPLPDKENK